MEQMLRDIIKAKDTKRLLALEARNVVNVCAELVYSYFLEYERLNHQQKVLYLCVKLEDACQADTILSLSEDEALFLHMPDICKAYEEIGAPKTAVLINQFIELLPAGTFTNSTIPEWKWFFEDQARSQTINEIDGQICNYPDGVMKNIYHSYVSQKGIAEKLLENI